MQKIAFLSFNWDYEIVSEYYLGLQEYLEGREDVQVVVFNSFGYFYARHKPMDSSFRVFSLCDLDDYDGVLVQGNRTWPPELRQRIVDHAVLLGKPVVSINYDLKGACTVGTNNYREEYELVRRVLRDRGCRRPVFVSGLKTSVEAQDRTRGYRDACAGFGIPNATVYQANWQIESGMAVAQRMLRKPANLPDVVFCCNDDLAVGVQETLQAAGIRVPEDVMVTGFDNREVHAHMSPRITTIDRDYRTIAKTAIKTILRALDGEKLPSKVFSPARQVLTESCRYEAESKDAGHVASHAEADSTKDFCKKVGDFQAATLDAEVLYSVLENCEALARELGCPSAYLSLNDDYLDSGVPGGGEEFGKTCRLVAHSGPSLMLPCDGEHVYARYETSRLLPPGVPFDRPLYIVSQLRHGSSSIGMLVTEGVPGVMRQGYLALYINLLSASIDAVRNLELLRTALRRE